MRMDANLMPIRPLCSYCQQKLSDFGAVLISPPNDDMCQKLHACRGCWLTLSPKPSTEEVSGMEATLAHMKPRALKTDNGRRLDCCHMQLPDRYRGRLGNPDIHSDACNWLKAINAVAETASL